MPNTILINCMEEIAACNQAKLTTQLDCMRSEVELWAAKQLVAFFRRFPITAAGNDDTAWSEGAALEKDRLIKPYSNLLEKIFKIYIERTLRRELRMGLGREVAWQYKAFKDQLSYTKKTLTQFHKEVEEYREEDKTKDLPKLALNLHKSVMGFLEELNLHVQAKNTYARLVMRRS